MTQNIDDVEKLEKFNEELVAPLPGRSPDRVSRREIDDEKAAFAEAMR
jgi:hypothetical protein